MPTTPYILIHISIPPSRSNCHHVPLLPLIRPPCPIQLFIDPSPSNRTRVINDDHHASTYSNNTQARPPLPPLDCSTYRGCDIEEQTCVFIRWKGMGSRAEIGTVGRWPPASKSSLPFPSLPSPRRPLRPFGCRKLIRPRGGGEGRRGYARFKFELLCRYVRIFGPVSIWPSFPVPRVSVLLPPLPIF